MDVVHNFTEVVLGYQISPAVLGRDFIREVEAA